MIVDQIKQQIQENPVILYMKGTKEQPQCGFSAQAVDSLMQTGVDFVTVDVLSNPDIRSNMHLVANWPTFPQLFIAGELVGGSDIIIEQAQNGELAELLAKVTGE